VPDDARSAIRAEHDILAARRVARDIATQVGFTDVQLVEIATAISEIARNTLRYASEGEMTFVRVRDGARHGVRVVASDRGPGIPDVEAAMNDGYSTGGGLGLGLPGARRLMDAFEIVSACGAGTTITMTKWRRT
jgi:serine/threonine-protein kinase RsbT